jgi:LmbE family N-acetylglucosaminyl deacetylase
VGATGVVTEQPNQPGQPPVTVRAVTTDLPVPTSALAIGAHPDDVEFGAGATLAKWAAAGCIVHHLVCTDGSKGTWDATADTAALAAARQIEQRDAARRLGARGEVIFLGQTDGELSSDLELVGAVAEVIRRLRPQVVLGHDPWKRYRLHPDHRVAGLLACDGIVAARDPHFFPAQGLAPHRPEVLLLWEADTVHHVEDVDGFVDVKIDALEAHASQFESTMHATDDAMLERFRTDVRTRLALLGNAYGLGAAELFARIDDL